MRLLPRQRAARHLNNHTQERLFFTKIKLDPFFKVHETQKTLNQKQHTVDGSEKQTTTRDVFETL